MRWFKSIPIIRMSGYVLGSLTEGQANPLFTIYSDSRVCSFLQRNPMRNKQEAIELIRKWQDDFACQRGIRWGIYHGPEDAHALIGTVAIHYVDIKNQRAELGAVLLPGFWGKGIISRSIEKLKEIAFSDLGLHRLEIRCMPENKASVRIALKSGFTFAGILRDYVTIPGRGFADESVYSLLSSEYGS